MSLRVSIDRDSDMSLPPAMIAQVKYTSSNRFWNTAKNPLFVTPFVPRGPVDKARMSSLQFESCLEQYICINDGLGLFVESCR